MASKQTCISLISFWAGQFVFLGLDKNLGIGLGLGQGMGNSLRDNLVGWGRGVVIVCFVLGGLVCTERFFGFERRVFCTDRFGMEAGIVGIDEIGEGKGERDGGNICFEPISRNI
jgi:hypothetical protein